MDSFAEPACRSHYSFLEGASSPRDLVEAAASLGIGTLGLCDRNGLYGVVEFVQEARRAGLRAVIGVEVDLAGGDRLRLLARGREGYRQLSRTVSAAQLAGEKGQPLLDLALAPVDPVGARSGAGRGDPDGAAAGGRAASRRPRRRFLPPPERPASLRPTAGPFPTGWPALPSTRPLATGAPAPVDPAGLSECVALAGGAESAITRALVRGDRRGAARLAGRLREAFGERAVLLLTHHRHPADGFIAAETAALARRCGLRLVATGLPVHATAADKPLHDVLTAIRHRATLDACAAHGLLLPNAEHRLRAGAELRALLPDHPEAFEAAAEIAAGCEVSLDFSDVRFPGFTVPEGETPLGMLRRLCRQAVPRRYRPVTPEVEARLARELGVIERTGLAEFFLITWDIMRFARHNGIPGQGRGSAADSIVAYLLGITRVDPVAHNLLFERFLHEDHRGTPDIDIDFSTDHRERVIQYVYDKYGADRTGMVANVVTFQPRMAIRQVGAALGFPETVVDRVAKAADGWTWEGVEDALQTTGVDRSLPWRQFLDLAQRVVGTPRHLGIHVGGMLVTGAPLVEVAPVERATMPGRVVVQFDKDDVEDLGLIKMDLLGLRTLSAVAECLDIVAASTGDRPDLDALPLDDARVYDTICAPDTIGLFQIESRAQLQSLYQSQPREFNDLIVQVAIIRPGPIQGDAVHPYLRRRQGLEPVTYLHPSLEPILSETRGVILYQEQILRIVMEVAGYSAGEADRFRRAMNRHRSRVEMQSLHDEFCGRCGARGLDADTAEAIFKAAAGFAEFGFCKSHAAAFARTAYETAWLRLEHPAAWLCALLNAQPMGFYHPSVLVEDGKRHGVRTLPVDAERSRARCRVEWVGEGPPPEAARRNGLVPAPRGATVGEAASLRAVEAACRAVAQGRRAPGLPASPRLGAPAGPWAVRLGFNYVRALGPAARAACEEAAAGGAAGSVAAFWRRTGLPRQAMENLVMVGAFDGVAPGRARRELLWELRETEDGLPPRRRAAAAPVPAPGPPRGRGMVTPAAGEVAPDAEPPLVDLPAPAPPLPPLSERDRMAVEYRLSELSTGPHLLAHLRERLDALGCVPLAAVPGRAEGSRLRVAGLVIARQAPMSAKGFRFFTLADEGAHLDLVFRPAVATRTRAVADFHPLLVVDGTLEADGGRLNLLVAEVRAIDGEGDLIDSRRARYGGGAEPAAPRPQHGHHAPALPASHDFR